MSTSERVEEFDRMFDILLVLLGIVTATLFQFISAVVPQQIGAQNHDLSQDQLAVEVTKEITRWLRVFFIPLILLIAIWFFNRIAMVGRPSTKRTVSEFCYVVAFTMLALDITYFAAAATMQPLIEVSSPNLGGSLYALIMNIVIFIASFGLIYSYETSAVAETGDGTGKKSRRFWRGVLVRTILMWFIAMVITNWVEMLSIYEFI